jgi:hypothetical protein
MRAASHQSYWTPEPDVGRHRVAYVLVRSQVIMVGDEGLGFEIAREGHGAAQFEQLRARPGRSTRPTGQNQLTKRAQSWIKLGGKVAKLPFSPFVRLSWKRI